MPRLRKLALVMSESNSSAEVLLEDIPMTDQESSPPEGGLEPEDGSSAESAEGTASGGDPEDSPTEPEAVTESEPESPQTGPGEQLSDEELVQAVSALVFASPEPLGIGRLVQLLEKPRISRVKAALDQVRSQLESSGLPLELREIAGGWRLMTAPSASEMVARLVKARKNEKLSPAGLETLAVIAYRQPVTKAEIEAIRGVQCGPMLRNLVDRGLAKVLGRADVPGGPLQYGTSKEFLDRFGMASLKDLPRDGELLKE